MTPGFIFGASTTDGRTPSVLGSATGVGIRSCGGTLGILRAGAGCLKILFTPSPLPLGGAALLTLAFLRLAGAGLLAAASSRLLFRPSRRQSAILQTAPHGVEAVRQLARLADSIFQSRFSRLADTSLRRFQLFCQFLEA